MNKRILAFLAAVCLLFTGCTSLLERSYSAIEPYTDRYWDTTAEDTLKAENYQDLVNSLLMVIAQHSEECVIHYYVSAGEDSVSQSLAASREVLTETLLGAYLLNNISVVYSGGDTYCTLTYSMSYREGVQDVDTLMTLSDTQSLADLLRLSVREEHESLTARFISKTSRSEVIETVEALWEELWLDKMESLGVFPVPKAPSADTSTDDNTPGTEESEENAETTDETPQASPDENSPKVPVSGSPDETPLPGTEFPSGEDLPQETELPVIEIPPCPWEILFYPDQEYAEIVEIRLG